MFFSESWRKISSIFSTSGSARCSNSRIQFEGVQEVAVCLLPWRSESGAKCECKYVKFNFFTS